MILKHILQVINLNAFLRLSFIKTLILFTSFNIIVIFNKSYSCPSSSLAPTHTWYPRDERLATGTLGAFHWIERLWTRANVWFKAFSANISYDLISTWLIWLGLGGLRAALHLPTIAILSINQYRVTLK